MNLGPLLTEQGRADEAEEHWRRAALDGWHDAMYEYAAILESRGELDSAKRWYRGAVEGEDPRAMNALGLLAESEGQLDEAENWYRRAAELNGIIWGPYTKAMRNLARLLRLRGDVRSGGYWANTADEYEDLCHQSRRSKRIRRSAWIEAAKRRRRRTR